MNTEYVPRKNDIVWLDFDPDVIPERPEGEI